MITVFILAGSNCDSHVTCSVLMNENCIISFIIPLLRNFTILGQKIAQNMPRYYTVEQGKNMD